MIREKCKGKFAILLELFLLLQLEGCSGQGNSGSNFFYYYSPTQRTQVNMNQNFGQVLNNPYLSHQQGLPLTSSHSPVLNYQFESTSIQPAVGQRQYIPSLYQTPASTSFAPSRFQVPFQHQIVTTSPTFSAFNQFGKGAFVNQQAQVVDHPQTYLTNNQYQPGAQPVASPQQGGSTYSFFESPFQYVQQRYLNPVLEGTTTTPAALTSVPVPTTEEANPDAIERKPKISSRFRYIEPPANPYSRISSYTSNLPYSEQRYYSTAVPSVPTPTGYSLNIGTEDGSKSSVHVSLGSLSNVQHLTEITGSRLIQRPQSFSSVIPKTRTRPTTPVAETPVETSDLQRAIIIMPQPDKPAVSTEQTSTTPTFAPSTIGIQPDQQQEQPKPDVPVPDTLDNVKSTVETLIKEPSVQTETILAPKPELTRKLSDINIPKRLVIRKKVARKRLQLQDEGQEVASENNGSSRRRISPNQLPEETKEQDGSHKGSTSPVLVSLTKQLEPAAQPSDAALGSSSSTQATILDIPSDGQSIQAVRTEEESPVQQHVAENSKGEDKQDDYYEYFASDQDVKEPKANPADMNDKPLPILPGLREEDFPGVFGQGGDNSVETDQGAVITRYKSSHPPIDVAFVSTENPSAVKVPEEPYIEEPSSTTQRVTLSTTSTTSTTTVETSAEQQGNVPEYHEVPSSPSSVTSPETPTEGDRNHLEVATISTTTELQFFLDNFDNFTNNEPAMHGENEGPPIDPHGEHHEQPNLVSSSTTISDIFSSSTEESTLLPEDTTSSSESPVVQSSSPEASDSNQGQLESAVDKEPKSFSDTSEDMAPTTTPKDGGGSTTEEFDDFLYSQEETHDEDVVESEDERISSDEEIGKAQRLALEETLRRLRNRNRPTNSTTEARGDQGLPDVVSANTSVSVNGTNGGRGTVRRRSRNFVRKPLQLANLTLPTSGPIPNINAVLEDDEGGHGRSRVIEKIQRFRVNSRRGSSTTTKRPRRVTRPTSDRAGQLEQIDSFSDSSYVGVDPFLPSTTPKYFPTVTNGRLRTLLESTIKAVPTTNSETALDYYSSPFPTTTTISTDLPPHDNSLLTPTEGPTYVTTMETTTAARTLTQRTITFKTSTASRTRLPTTPSTTIPSINDEVHNDSETDQQVDEPDSEGVTTLASFINGIIYTTTAEPFLSSTVKANSRSQTKPAGQLIIHEILPTQPPLKEISFVIGDSVEEEQVIQPSEQNSKEVGQKPISNSIVRVETKVEVSSSVQKIVEKSDESSEEKKNSGESGKTSSVKKVRVVIKRQRKTGEVKQDAIPFAIS